VGFNSLFASSSLTMAQRACGTTSLMKLSSGPVSSLPVSVTRVGVFDFHFKPISTDILAFAVGAPLSGRLSDKIVVKCRKERGGEWYPEDRLRATLFSAGVMVPLSTLGCGFLTAYVPGTIGLALDLICLFVNGLGVKSLFLSFCDFAPSLIFFLSGSLGRFRVEPVCGIFCGFNALTECRGYGCK